MSKLSWFPVFPRRQRRPHNPGLAFYLLELYARRGNGHDARRLAAAFPGNGFRYLRTIIVPSDEIDAWSNDFDASAKLFKLHGSVNWYRLWLDDRQTVVRTDAADPYHLKNAAGKQLDFRRCARTVSCGDIQQDPRPPVAVFFEQHVGAHQGLRDSAALVVTGYGFRDKAINTRIIDWLSQPAHRLILVHRDPVSALNSGRPAVRDAIGRAAGRGQVATIEKWVEDATWEEISADLP